MAWGYYQQLTGKKKRNTLIGIGGVFFVGGTEDVDALTVFENSLPDLGVDVVGTYNRDLMLFLYSGEMGIIMKENKLKIHADTGEIFENDRETGENFHKFLRFKLDKSKKTIQAILQYSRSFEDFKDHLSNMIDTEEQWELDIAFIYSKFFVTCYNSPIGLNSPIYLKHIRAHKDDEMLESINMNNCHKFLDSFIKLALSMSDYESDNKWIVNIGKKLRSTFRKYKNKLNDVAYVFYNYIRYSSVDNVLKVLSFLGLPKREGQKILKNMTHTKLYFDCVGRFIVTGATPIKNSTLPLSKIKPPAFLEEQIRLPDFSALLPLT